MSKRKSSSALVVKSADADMIFEDDDEIESNAGDSAKGSSSARVSARAKKAKAIYDPSEFNGPVHKRKKEALENERAQRKPAPKTAKPTVAHPKLTSPTNSPAKSAAIAKAFQVSPRSNTAAKPKLFEIQKRALDSKKSVTSTPVQKQPAVPVVSGAKEPSKRIQACKQFTGHNQSDSSSGPKKRRVSTSVSTGGRLSASDFDNASTVEYAPARSDIPKVRKWTHQQVSNYFSANLGFAKQEAAVFTDEEIDGETLMIMKRSDIVNTKFQHLKLGTALKMWSHIITFQTGKDDPTQAWK